MAFINLSSILNGGGHNGDDLVSVERPTLKTALEAHVPISDFFDELLRCQAKLVDNFYNRPIEVFHNDLLNKKDGVAFKMAKAISDECIGKYGNEVDKINDAIMLLTLVYPYINIDNCIRVKFASPSELKSYRKSTITLDDNNWKQFNGLGCVFDKFIVPYIRDFVNPEIEFTERDKKLYDTEREKANDFKKVSCNHSTFLIETNFSGIPVSYDRKTKEALTYGKPYLSNDGLCVLGKDGVFVDVKATETDNKAKPQSLHDFYWMSTFFHNHAKVQNVLEYRTMIDYCFVLGRLYANFKLGDEITKSIKSKLEQGDLKERLGHLSHDELNDVFSISDGDIPEKEMAGFVRLVGETEATIPYSETDRFNDLLIKVNESKVSVLGHSYNNGCPFHDYVKEPEGEGKNPFIVGMMPSKRELSIGDVDTEDADFDITLPAVSLTQSGSASNKLLSYVGRLSNYDFLFNENSLTCFVNDVYGISSDLVGGYNECVGMFNVGVVAFSVSSFDEGTSRPKAPSFTKSSKTYIGYSFIKKIEK